jgi:hypothetical protein
LLRTFFQRYFTLNFSLSFTKKISIPHRFHQKFLLHFQLVHHKISCCDSLKYKRSLESSKKKIAAHNCGEIMRLCEDKNDTNVELCPWGIISNHACCRWCTHTHTDSILWSLISVAVLALKIKNYFMSTLQ